jgi:hypothetical protein
MLLPHATERNGRHDPVMAIGRTERFEERRPRVIAIFGDDDKTLRVVFHVIELMEMAWHDCYAEITPSEDVVDDVLLCSGGTLGGLIDAAHLAVIDRRDLSVWAANVRSNAGSSQE